MNPNELTCESVVRVLQKTILRIDVDNALVIFLRKCWVRAGIIHADAFNNEPDRGLLVLANARCAMQRD
jgi:hypothetical protein